jgi:hypothetical protein
MFMRRDVDVSSLGAAIFCRRMGVQVVWESQIVEDRGGIFIKLL